MAVKGSIGAMILAIDKVNNDPMLTALREHDIAFAYHEIDTSCKPIKTVIEILDQKKKYDVFIGE